MATPLTADQQLAAYKAAGIKKIVQNRGWRTRGMWRISAKGWQPRGIIIHQTAGNLGSRTVQQYADDILNGDPACPDKCNVFIPPDGSLWVNAAGRANHCLQYSAKALAALTRETFPLAGKYHDLRGSQQNMNRYTYGVEMIATAPNAAQIETAARWAAALCRAHGWSAGAVAGHGEVADDRDYSDPGIDMGAFRARVAALIKSKNSPKELELTMSQYTAIMSKLAWLEKILIETQRRVTADKGTDEFTQKVVVENQKRINQVNATLSTISKESK
ncbi:N-acetylmuramoyl-L-alanine amidase [Acidipropionibacterium jensenii]|uniref:N-acetylmuramoyl-L-alanine amidase n=1 Tax=Acidipropionibacterium jensenii TaxID=1749 RepID=A0A3S4YYK5_9ACTN|nr:peptidoglycan recognition family protein [Acidipropionibacterium jensenii]VEI04096.1 N-acetylmuramoyl-L-alanine amidase [Acidipropionibacterium jensenii]